MLCPNCGSESKPDRRFCFNCGRALMSARRARAMSAAAGQTPDIGFVTMRDVPLNTGELKFPEEMVFIPTFDEEPFRPAPLAPRPLPNVPFEDGEADDEFERSLGGLRLEEIEEAVNVDAIKTAQPVVSEAFVLPDQVGETREENTALSVVNESAGVPLVSLDSIEAVTAEPPRREFRVLGTLLFGVIAFAAGVISTVLLYGNPNRLPDPVEIAVVPAEPQTPTPPNGMAYVPGGEFQMGSDDGDVFSKPAHTANVAPFFIDITEVTNEAYAEFVKATGHAAPQSWIKGLIPSGQDKFPVTGVSWYDALEFAAWSGKRLPTEAEWEFAARGSDKRTFPWGDLWTSEFANVASKSGIRQVGGGAASPFGLYDMAGNVWEWTASDAKSYAGGKQIPWSRLRLKVIRGGNWQSNDRTAASTFRGFYGATGEKEYNSTGFRCVKDLPRD